MITPDTIDLSTLPSLSLAERNQFPRCQGIYFVIADDGKLLYIGRSINIAKRWSQHHRHPDLEQLVGVRLAWLQVSDALLLPEIEKALIQYFKPQLNKKSVKKSSSCITKKRHPSAGFKPLGEKTLAKRVIGVRLEEDIDTIVRSLPDSVRSRWLRKVITDAVKEQLIDGDIFEIESEIA